MATGRTLLGWTPAGERRAIGPPPVAYRDLRAASESPQRLPADALCGDSISGRGSQTFRVRTGDGEFDAQLINPDRTVVHQRVSARQGYLDVIFPEGEWTFCGLVIASVSPEETELPPQHWPQALPRPAFKHTALKSAVPDKNITITLNTWPLDRAATVRLHYRAVNQLAQFKTLEAPASKAVFIIPASDVKEQWDLMYYFEVLNTEKSGWFEPDPKTTTPYHVINIAKPTEEEKDPDDHTAQPPQSQRGSPAGKKR